jgi:hypothetical protein
VIIRVVRYSLIAGVLALAGCTDAAGEPSTLPDLTAPPSGTPTPTAPPTAEPPVEPDNAHEYSAEGVEAFTLYAIEVINYAYQTNDVTYLEQIKSDDCQFCDRTVDQLTVIGEAGGRIEGGQMSPGPLSITGPTEGVQTSAGADVEISASTTINGNGNVTDQQPARAVYFIFNLVREGEAWKLQEVLRASQSLA